MRAQFLNGEVCSTFEGSADPDGTLADSCPHGPSAPHHGGLPPGPEMIQLASWDHMIGGTKTPGWSLAGGVVHSPSIML